MEKIDTISTNKKIDFIIFCLSDSGAFSSNAAFKDCMSLKQVIFVTTSSIISIEVNIFINCSSLMEITNPSSVTKIKRWAFDSCKSLKRVLFDDNSSLNVIGDYAFKDCTSLKQIILPPSLTKILEGANLLKKKIID